MKNIILFPIGITCFLIYIVLDLYTETHDFIIGLFLGLSIGINLVAVYQAFNQKKT